MQSIDRAVGNDPHRYVVLLKACSKKKDLCEGVRLHAEIVNIRGGELLARNPHLANTLISMYAKCGAISMAEQVLEDLPFHDIVSWNALFAGYVQYGQDNKALQCIELVHNQGHFLDVVTLTCVLKVCGRRTWGLKGKHAHCMIVSNGLLLEKDIALGTALVDMYAKCNMLMEAQEVFDELLHRNTISWNVLISGYVHHGRGMKALLFFEMMLSEGLSPDVVTSVLILKTCGNLIDLASGRRIHYWMVDTGFLGKDIVLGNALIDMYAKCGQLQRARELMEKISDRDVVSWSTLIARYAESGEDEEAFKCFECMLYEGHYPDVVTFITILKVCGSAGAIDKGKQIHEEITRRGWLVTNSALGNTLVDMYAKCGMLAKAEQVLEQLPIRDLVSWNTLISGYGQQGETQKAFICFQKLKDEGLDPDTITFICILQACSISGAIDKGKQIHDEIISRALDKDVMLVTALIDMYAKCGVLTRAQELLEELPVRDLISWSAMIGGYVHQGESPEALRCYKELESEGLCPDSVLLISVLKACGKMGGMEKTAHIYDEVLRIGSLEKDVMLSNSLMDMYVKCGELAKAQNILEELPIRDVVSWNVIIHGYAQQGRSHEALNCFSQMQREGVLPDAATYVSILNTFSETFDADNGKDIHDQILKRGLPMRNDGVLCNSLVGMYTKCAPLATAREVFDGLPSIRCIEVWNTLIIGHAHRGQSHEALKYFEQMRSEGQLPNSITLTCVLKACGISGSTGKAKCIHSEVVSRGFLGSNLVLGNALVDMYAKCGMFVKANQVLQELPIRNVVSWSGLISGYLQQEQGHAALNCFGLMRSDGLCADEVTLACIVKACGYSGALARGELIHKEIVTNGWFGRDIVLGNALVDMYAKCGQLEKAKEVMEEDGHLTNIISWNALISGYGRRRQGHEALGCFQCMQSKGFSPDKVTMLSLLSACGHCGLLAEAQALYENMARAYGVVPDVEHRACMVSCLGRYGHFDEASSLVLDKTAAICVDPTAWLVLLGACREWGNSMVGRLCFNRIHE